MVFSPDKFPLDILVRTDTIFEEMKILAGEEMSCFHPIKAIKYKNRTHLGSIYNSVAGDYKDVIRHDIRILKREEYDKFVAGFENEEIEVMNLPCGQCRGCRMDYAQQWADRLMLEYQLFDNDKESCHFITLTIDDKHIDCDGTQYVGNEDVKISVLRPFCDPDTGEVIGYSHSLNIRDAQLFLKRLRREYGNDRIRFFLCGEYGDRTFRPHYHLIVFGLHLPVDDLHFYKKSGLGYAYKNSDSLSEIWPFGYNVVAPVTWESCCYVARYMVKKLKGEGAALYDKYNMQPPFVTMSRRPGIASEYFQIHGLDPERTMYSISCSDGNRQFAVPRYIEEQFEFYDPDKSEMRKQRRKLSAINKQKFIKSKTDIDVDRYLAIKEEKIMKSLKYLDNFRNLE